MLFSRLPLGILQGRGLLLTLLLLRFTGLFAQTITSFTPSTGTPGTVVTVTGTNLAGVTGLAFNGVPTTGITILSSTSIAAYVPVNATSGSLKATSPNGTGTSGTSFTVVPAKADVTVAVTPAGPVSACGGPTLTAVATTKPFALTGTGVGGYPHVTALQPDGKILVGGYFDSYNGSARGGVLRLNPNGSLDPTFAPTGSGINYDVDAMVLQPDGKVLVGGKFTTYNGASCRYLTRLNADGTRDASFNLTGTGLNSSVQSLALQPDGKIMVGGVFSNYNSTIRNVVLRLNADGSLDTSFSIAGTGIVGNITTIAVQPDGQLLVGGYIERFNGASPGSLVRLYPNGALDNSFRVTQLSGSTVLTQTLQPDNKILISAAVYGPNGRQQAIARLQTNGSLDYSFSPIGSGLNSAVQGMAVQPDGKVVVAGNFNEYNGMVRNYVTRLNADGTLDNSFNAIGPSYAPDDMVLQPNGKIVLVGSFSSYNGNGPGKIVRLNADGSLDATASPTTDATYAWSPSGTTGATVVPTLAGGSYQAVATVGGSLYLSNSVTVTPCLNAPAITGFTPTSGPVGTVLTVDGTNLTSATSVTFSGSISNVVSSGFTVNAAGTQLTGLVVPAGAQTGPFSITTSGGMGSSPSSFTVTAPAITSLSPASVVAGSGALTLTVNGANFVRGAMVSLNGTNLTTSYGSATQLTAAVPSASTTTAGSYPVRVANSPVGGSSTSAAATFTVTVPVPTITSFTPANGLAGTAVTVTGTNLLGATGVTLNGAAVPSFVVANATTLIFTVPAGATSGLITVTTPGGTATSASPFLVGTPNLMPVVTALSPNSILVNSGDFTLTVSGGNFVRSSVVNFPLGPVSTTYVSGNQLTAIIPAAYLRGLAIGNVTVTSPAPGGGTSNGILFSVTLPDPTITSFTPTSGPVGTTVTVKGTNFQLVKYVGLASPGNSNALFNVIDANMLTFVVPTPAVSGQVEVITSGGTGYSTAIFMVTPPPNLVPTITSLSPSTAVAGSSDFALTVNGTGFVNNSVINFNGAALHTTYISATQLTAQIPASAVATAGTIGITVTSPAPGGGTSAAATFTVTTPAPTLVSFAPAQGLVGTSVTVTGTALTGASVVTLNGASVGSFTVVDAATLTFLVPANATSGLVAVTTLGGTATSASAFTVLQPNPLPTLVSLAPGSVTAGTPAFTLTVTGTGFVTGSLVQLAGVALVTTYQSATQLTAQVPASAVVVAGSYSVMVTSPAPGGGTTAELALAVTLPVPTIVSFTPGSGAAGITVTVVGTNFNGATALTLNGSPVNDFAVSSPTILSFVVPAGASSGLVAVTTPGGTATSATAFTVIVPNPVPAITVLSPASAVAGSNAITLTVSGSGFAAGSVVSFNGTALQTTYTSATQLTAQLPATALATVGSYDVLVTNPAPGGGTSAAATFTVTTPAPTLVSFAPAQGLVGTSVTVTGTNLTGASALTLNGVSVGNFTVADASTLTFVVPVGATSGLLAVTTPGGTATSANSFIVLLPTPTIASLAPTTVVAGSGDFTLKVTGTGFISGSVVNFGTTALRTTYGSATQLTAQVPASLVAAAGSVNVAVANPSPEQGGTSVIAAFTITAPAIAAPTLVSFTPGSGLVGTAVTVTGTNLLGATAMTLNGVSVGSFTVINATTLTFVVPTGASSGLLTIITPGGTATSASSFTVLLPNPAPTISSLSPTSAVVGSGATTLTVLGTGYVSGSVVQFNGATIPTVFMSATQLTATIPAAALAMAGTYAVMVENPAPGGGTSPSVSFTVVTPTPTLISFTPASGPVGTLVTVTGTYLLDATAITLNGIPVAAYTVLNASSLTFTVPVGATSGLVSVTTPGSTATSATTFTVINPNPVPTLASLSPSTVVAGSSDFTLTLTGTGFGSGSAVLFNGTVLATTYVSATQLTAQVPASAVATAGSYDIMVRNPAPGGGVSAALPFVVTVPAPTISSFTPTMGGAGTLVTVTGTNLSGATQVRIGNMLIPTFTVVSATSLTLVVPAVAGGVSGYLTIITPGGTATSTMAFGGVLAATGSQALTQLQVYPNPFQSKLTLVLPSAEPVQVLLRDITGRVILPFMPLPASKQLVLPTDLATGVYLLEIHQGDATTTRRLLKE